MTNLSNFPLLAAVEPAFLPKVTAALRWRDYAAGENIIRKDDLTRDLYFLAAGRLLAVNWTEEGREIIFADFATGSYFGELTALDGKPRSLWVHARSPARIAALPESLFHLLMRESAGFRGVIITDMVTRIRQLTERNSRLVSLSVPARLRDFILSAAALSGNLQAGVELAPFPTHAEIAAQIGANREAVSRALAALAQEGVISTARGRLKILSPERLIAQAE